jgi:glycosyltransferase involved in cell wall biosynthesis
MNTTNPTGPLVSVVMATYNRERYLGLAVRSVIAQTFTDWELIVIDDGSVDGTPALMEPLLADPRIRYERQENKGQASARNRGLKAARGEFVCFMDSDNLWLADKLRRQVELMKSHPDVDVLYGENDIIDEEGRVQPSTPMRRYSGHITEQLLIDNFVTFNTAMVRRHRLLECGGLDERIRRADDYDLWLRLSVRCKFLHVPEVWAQYRVMADQISSNKEGRFASNAAIIEQFMAANPQLVSPAMVRGTWCRFYTRRGRWRASVGRRREALQDYLQALRFGPFSRHPWRALARLAITGR